MVNLQAVHNQKREEIMSKSKRQSGKKQDNKNLLWIIAGAALILVIALGAVFYWPLNNTAASGTLPSEISVDEAAAKREAGAFILDVREPEEWVEYHIPGATLIPLGELETRVNEVPHDREVVVVCRSGNRSQVGRDILLKSDFNQVTSMAGGMIQWSAAGYDTVSGP
jgi:rhodanese-related sulfurtransferase